MYIKIDNIWNRRIDWMGVYQNSIFNILPHSFFFQMKILHCLKSNVKQRDAGKKDCGS